VESPVPAVAGEQAKPYRFVELGRVPDKSRTPKEAAMISKKYLEEKIKLSI
jgi:hypothetical protein